MLTEDEITWDLYLDRKRKGSRLFFKVKHNISTVRDWSYFCAPDVDLLEVRADNTLIAYEIKGQRKYRTGEADWPALYAGLGQALAYLLLPSIYSSSQKMALFDGGAFDYVYLVNARPEADPPENVRILQLTPLGYIAAYPKREMNELMKPKVNPLKSEGAKNHLLQNLATLDGFSEESRTFRNLKAKYGAPT